MARLTPELIRHCIEDRVPEDNELDLDLSFTDAEITHAMGSCARGFNSIPPLVVSVHPNELDDETSIFIDGTLMYLYQARLARLMRNRTVHDAGGVRIDIHGPQIEAYQALVKKHGDDFRQAAADLKSTINLESGYGFVG